MEKQRHREILLLGTLLIVIYTAVQHADLAWGLLLALLKICLLYTSRCVEETGAEACPRRAPDSRSQRPRPEK